MQSCSCHPVYALSSKTEPLNKKLTDALLNNDTNSFRSILETEGWPRYSKWSDFDLLMRAIKLGRKQIVYLLLDLGCRVCKNPNMPTALQLAATKPGWTDVIERLVKSKLRVADKNSYKKDYTALHYAFFEGIGRELGHTIDLLLTIHLRQAGDSKFVNVVNKTNFSFMHIACTRPSLDVVKAFFEADKNSIHSEESLLLRTALHFAVDYGRHQIAEFLLHHGADVYKQDASKNTPLHLALKCGDARMIDLLLAYDTRRKNDVNLNGLSHLMVACAGSNAQIVKQYLQNDESPLDSINAQVHQSLGDLTAGCSSLHIAAIFGRADTVELLLDRGANCCATTFSKYTAHYFARAQGCTRVYEILQEHCDIVKRCRETRAESPDFRIWGENYERDALEERIRMMKYLDRSLKNLRALRRV